MAKTGHQIWRYFPIAFCSFGIAGSWSRWSGGSIKNRKTDQDDWIRGECVYLSIIAFVVVSSFICLFGASVRSNVPPRFFFQTSHGFLVAILQMFPILSSFPYLNCCRLVSTEAKIWKHKNSKSNRIPSLYFIRRSDQRGVAQSWV